MLAADPKPKSKPKPKPKAAKSRKTSGGDAASWFARWRNNPGQAIGIVAFAGFFGAVAVNALVFQNGRSAAPPLPPVAPQTQAAAQSPTANMPPLSTLATVPVPQGFVHAAAATVAADEPQAPVAAPTAQPARRPVAVPQPAETHQHDAIADLLNGGAPSARRPVAVPQPAETHQRDAVADLLNGGASPSQPASSAASPNKNVLAAQRALTKLGFAVPATGTAGAATRQAVEKFEKSRGLPPKGELTPKIMRELAAASGIAIN